jgi:hypothetical protein
MFISYVVITACSAAYSDLGISAAGPAVLAFIFMFNGAYGIGVSVTGTQEDKHCS